MKKGKWEKRKHSKQMWHEVKDFAEAEALIKPQTTTKKALKGCVSCDLTQSAINAKMQVIEHVAAIPMEVWKKAILERKTVILDFL